MKFKYMIRGLGIGIIITAAVMGAYGRKAVADARVAVLKEYGLGGDNELMSETQDETPETESVPVTTEPVIVRDSEIESEISSVLDAAKESEQASKTETQPEETETAGTETPKTEEQTDTGGATAGNTVVQITISSGDDSGTVTRKLETAGVIPNAAEYDLYLRQHGYDRKLSTGTKSISIDPNMSDGEKWRKITEIITGR